MTPTPPPTPFEIANAPELAILAALDATLDLALRALLAAHPQLGDPDVPSWARDSSPSRTTADRILALAVRLTHELNAYRRATAPSPRPEHDPEIPF